jgi:hypothetical protein
MQTLFSESTSGAVAALFLIPDARRQKSRAQ